MLAALGLDTIASTQIVANPNVDAVLILTCILGIIVFDLLPQSGLAGVEWPLAEIAWAPPTLWQADHWLSAPHPL